MANRRDGVVAYIHDVLVAYTHDCVIVYRRDRVVAYRRDGVVAYIHDGAVACRHNRVVVCRHNGVMAYSRYLCGALVIFAHTAYDTQEFLLGSCWPPRLSLTSLIYCLANRACEFLIIALGHLTQSHGVKFLHVPMFPRALLPFSIYQQTLPSCLNIPQNSNSMIERAPPPCLNVPTNTTSMSRCSLTLIFSQCAIKHYLPISRFHQALPSGLNFHQTLPS